MTEELQPLDLTKLRVVEITESLDGSFEAVVMPIRNVKHHMGNYYTALEMWHIPERCRKPRFDPLVVGRSLLDRIQCPIHDLEVRLFLYDISTADAVERWKAARLAVLHEQAAALMRRVVRMEETVPIARVAAGGD